MRVVYRMGSQNASRPSDRARGPDVMRVSGDIRHQKASRPPRAVRGRRGRRARRGMTRSVAATALLTAAAVAAVAAPPAMAQCGETIDLAPRVAVGPGPAPPPGGAPGAYDAAQPLPRNAFRINTKA